MNWLEVALTVDGESAEAVAEVLARFAPNGVAAEQGVRQDGESVEGIPGGPVTVRAYLPADDQVEATRLRIEESLHHLGMIRPLPEPAFRLIADQNWMEAWKRHYKPIAIGRRLMIVPAWMDSAAGERIAVRINPGMAFGTGTHPSTQLCLELIERVLSPQERESDTKSAYPPASFIDVGCGSGILSLAALGLGATSALGVDTDPDAIENARENAAANGIGPELALGVGSVKDILDGRFARRRASLVAANILAPVIAGLFTEGLADLMEEGGTMVLGGILEDQSAMVLSAAAKVGLGPRDRRQIADWVALAMSR